MEMTTNVRPQQPETKQNPLCYNEPVHDPTPAPVRCPCVRAMAVTQPDLTDYIISEENFKQNASNFIAEFATEMLKTAYPSTTSDEITDTISCLTLSEYQVLPVWADGNNYGSDDLFSNLDIPSAETREVFEPESDVHAGSATPTCSSPDVEALGDIVKELEFV